MSKTYKVNNKRTKQRPRPKDVNYGRGGIML